MFVVIKYGVIWELCAKYLLHKKRKNQFKTDTNCVRDLQNTECSGKSVGIFLICNRKMTVSRDRSISTSEISLISAKENFMYFCSIFRLLRRTEDNIIPTFVDYSEITSCSQSTLWFGKNWISHCSMQNICALWKNTQTKIIQCLSCRCSWKLWASPTKS